MNKPIDISNSLLRTDRLILRPFEESDLYDLYEYAKVPGVGERAGWAHHKNIEESKNILRTFVNGKSTFAIIFNGKVIGSIGIDEYDERLLREFKEKEGRELGVVLSKDYWGRGLMTEAVKKVISYLFEKENLDFIVSGYFDENKRSKNVQRKCGFIPYKRRTFETSYGQIKNGWLCILEREDWKDFS